MILLTGAGGLFTRLGKFAGLVNDVNTFRGGASAGELVRAVQDVLAAADGDTALIRGTIAAVLAGLPSAQSSLGGLLTIAKSCAQALLIQQVANDTPLAQPNVANALAVLKTQILAGGAYVTPNTVAAAVTPAAGNFGSGAIVCGTRDARGQTLANLLAENIAVSVNAECAGAGTLQFQGTAAQSDPLNWTWPAGSGCNKSIASVCAAGNTGYLAGGGFESFVANAPANWTVVTGTAGTDFGPAGAGLRGANALKLIGGTGVLTSLSQAPTSLAARAPYAVNLWLKSDVVPASGSLTIDLYNGASVIADEAGNACSLVIPLSALTTSYAARSAFFLIGDPLPPTVTLRVYLTAAVPAGSNIFLDEITLQPATQLGTYPGDTIWAAVAGGAADWALRDTLTIATTNSRASQWQQAFDRLFNCRQLGFVLPTAGTTAISDTLISD